MTSKEIIKKLQPTSIRSQLILGIAIVNIVLMSVFILEMMDRQKTSFLKLNHDRTLGLSINLASTANSYVISYELARLQKLVSTYKEIPNLEYAFVTSDDGTVLAHSDKKYLGLKATDAISAKLKPVNTTQILLEDNNILDIATPILNHNEIVGWARIGVSQKYIEPYITEIWNRGIVFILISLIAGSLFAVVVASGLSRGLQKLVTVAGKIRSGDRNLRAEPSGSGEISQLGTAFNQMLDDISANEKLLNMVLENMPVGVFILDSQGKVLSLNPAAQQIWEGAKYVSKGDYNVYKGWFPNGKEIQSHEWGAAVALNENRAVINQEAEIEGFEGNRKTILNSCIPMHDTGGKIVGVISINVDITERKKAEEKIRESEERYRSIISVSNTGAWEYHGNSEYLWCSPEYFSMLGRKQSDYNISGSKNLQETWIDLLHPEDRERSIGHFAEYLKKGSVGTYENYFRMLHIDGSWVWIWSRGQTLSDINGNLTNFTVGTHIDITEQKKAEERIRASEKTRKHIINSALDAIVGMNKEGLVTIWTPQAERIFGWKEEEVLGKKMSEVIIPHQQRVHHERGLAHYTKTGEGPLLNRTMEVAALHKSGKEFPVELSIAVVKDTDNDFFCAFIRDITERKEAEKKLKQNEEKNRALIENISDTIVLINEKLEVVYQSPSFIRTAGLTLHDHKDRTVLQVMHPDELDECLDIINNSKRSPSVAIPFQLRTLHKNGNYIWVEGTVTNLLQNESVNAFVLNYRDITERKNAENELKEMNEQLRLLSSHLQSIREEERTSMAREIHDELGQQLTGLKMDIISFKRKNEKVFPEIIKETEKMTHLIDETVKTVRRIATELRPGILDDLGLTAAIEWQAIEFEKRTGIKCLVDAEEVSEDYSGDINTAVFRIFQESLTNVARHAEAKEVRAKLSVDSNVLVLEIEDDGKGISEERKNNKTSLGLLGMKERAGILRGEFSIRKNADKGTCVTLKIPIQYKVF